MAILTGSSALTPNGDAYGAGGLYLRPRDLLKLGQLYLNGGVWNGKRVISKEWAERSISRESTFGPTLGADHDYGYGWHLYHFEIGSRSYQAYAAGGNGGQIVMVIPFAAHLQYRGRTHSQSHCFPPRLRPGQSSGFPSAVAQAQRNPAEDEKDRHLVGQKMKDVMPDYDKAADRELG